MKAPCSFYYEFFLINECNCVAAADEESLPFVMTSLSATVILNRVEQVFY